MELINLAQKFTANPNSLTDEEIGTLASEFHLAHPQTLQFLPTMNSYPGGWDRMKPAIAKTHYERSNFEALSKNPFASPEEIAAMPSPSPLAELPQSELGRMIFGA